MPSLQTSQPSESERLSIHADTKTEIRGGLSNKLYVCQLLLEDSIRDDPNQPTKVIYRVYGVASEDYEAQLRESVVFSMLSERGIGPRLYGVFQGGRLEEYLECRTLLTEDLPDEGRSRFIAQQVAKYHMLKMPLIKTPMDFMEKLQKYYENRLASERKDICENPVFKELMRDNNFPEEMAYIKNMIQQADSPVVFCHNDLQEGNLLEDTSLNDGTNNIHLIDFEYSCYNYRGFDIANHFCEWMFDYSRKDGPKYWFKPENYPKLEQQEMSGKTEGAFQLDVIIAEAKSFTLLSHLFWSLWSVTQAINSDIDFGYLEYARDRMSAYREWKQSIENNLGCRGIER